MKEQDKISLIFDLDETLIHATESELAIAADFRFDPYFVYKRPHVSEFLIEMSEHYKLAIWSSASDDYVQEIVNTIKPAGVDFEFIWGRSRCTMRRNFELGKYVHEKHLKKAKKKGYSLDRMLIVDDSPEKVRANFGNAVYVIPFLGGQSDDELELLGKYLKSIAEEDNVRSIEKRGWRRFVGD